MSCVMVVLLEYGGIGERRIDFLTIVHHHRLDSQWGRGLIPCTGYTLKGKLPEEKANVVL